MQEYLKNVTFHYKDELVLFDANGDPPGHYDIMNFQRVGALCAILKNLTDSVTDFGLQILPNPQHKTFFQRFLSFTSALLQLVNVYVCVCVFFNVIVFVLSIVEKVTSLFGYFKVLRKLENL